jgi:hypothetical protein
VNERQCSRDAVPSCGVCVFCTHTLLLSVRRHESMHSSARAFTRAVCVFCEV